MLPRHQDPIVAVATAPGRGAVGIVRASGRDLSALVAGVCGRPLVPRHARFGPFVDARGEAIDRGLAIHFPAPHSYTGEEVLELQAHGGPVLLQLLLARCLEAMPALRLAGPGEFTERAFLNGKLDLAQAEAVGDLIEASTEAAVRSAARSLGGDFSRAIEALAQDLLRLRTLVEATLDFPEEEIDFLEQADARGQLARLRAALGGVLGRARQGALLREGITVVLAGPPNVGKSSLLNALAGAERAIVTPIAGTTRDTVRETIQIEGVPVHVVDTAGIRELAGEPGGLPGGDPADTVERIGIERSWAAIAQADAVLVLHDLSRADDADHRQAEARIAAQLGARGPGEARLLHVYNKSDLAVPTATHAAAQAQPHPAASGQQDPTAPAPGDRPGSVRISAATGAGLDTLRARLLSLAGWHAEAGGAEGVFLARARHLAALRETEVHLARAAQRLAEPAPALELLAEELRLAHQQLGGITGRVDTEDLLGEIFGRFCIGK
jgi:tRNA modification GTPase